MARPALDPGLVERITPGSLAGERALPLHADLHDTLGASLQRGVTVSTGGRETTPATAVALSLMLAAGPSSSGSWVAAVGMPDLGLLAAAEAGIALERFALVPYPEGRPGVGVGPHALEEAGLGRPAGKTTWADVVASLIDGFDVVLACPPTHLKSGIARRLVARARERQAVLVGVGGWPEGAALRIDATVTEWTGLEQGSGHLSSIRREILRTGRVSLRPSEAVAARGGVGAFRTSPAA